MRRVARVGATVILAMLVAAAVPAMAQAIVYIEGEDIPVAETFGGPAGLAVRQSTGDLYVTLPFGSQLLSSTDSVEWFDSAGVSQGTFAPGLAATGVAVDPTDSPADGDLHVFDSGLVDGSSDIHSFTATGDPIGTPFAVDSTLDQGNFVFDRQQIATDAFGNIYYPDTVDDTVEIYSSTGSLQADRSGSGVLVDPSGVAVDNDTGPGGPNIYAVDTADGGRVVKLSLFDPNSSSVLAGTTGATSVAVNFATGDVYVGIGSGSAFHIVVYDSTGAEIGDFGAGDFADGNPFPRQIAVDVNTARVYVSDSGATPKRVAVYEEGAPPPTVTTMSASGAKQTTATLAGTVAQSDAAAIETCRFEYTDDADFQANGFANADDAACASEYPNGAASLVLVTANVSGLDPNTTYHFRLVASNSGGAGEGGDAVFATLPNPPTVVTAAAADVRQTHATLGGSVNPNGGPVTTCQIEFGTTSAYGQSRPCASGPGGGTSAVGVSASVAGLSPGTTYHFRVRALNGGGATDGADETFRTADRPDPCAVDADSCKPTDQCVVTPATCKPVTAVKATVPGAAAVKAGRALIRLSCKGAAGATCKGTLRLRARIKSAGGRRARTLTIGTTRYELTTGKSQVLRVRLSRAARLRLASKGRLRGRVTGSGVSDRAVLLRLRPSE